MKKTKLSETLHESTTELLMNNLKSIPEVAFISKIDEALEKRGLTQNKLATMCGLRPSTITEVIKSSRSALTKSHIASIMIALRITDIREIIDIEFDPETVKQFEKERKEWIENDVIPQEVVELYKKNVQAAFNPNIR